MTNVESIPFLISFCAAALQLPVALPNGRAEWAVVSFVIDTATKFIAAHRFDPSCSIHLLNVEAAAAAATVLRGLRLGAPGGGAPKIVAVLPNDDPIQAVKDLRRLSKLGDEVLIIQDVRTRGSALRRLTGPMLGRIVLKPRFASPGFAGRHGREAALRESGLEPMSAAEAADVIRSAVEEHNRGRLDGVRPAVSPSMVADALERAFPMPE